MLEMARSFKDSHEELEDDDEVPNTVKSDGNNREKNRSKHSQTEQRRRCKINDRFQILKDLLPQNDQRRDKASFLLEVIEYIQFLQEKLNYYEGPYEGWRTEPAKLTPWVKRSQQVSAEKLSGQSQVTKNGSELQNDAVISPLMVPSAQNSEQSELGSALVYKQIDHLPGSAIQVAPLNMQPLDIFATVGTGGMPTQALPDSISNDVNMDSHPQLQPEIWQRRDTTTSSVSNNTLNILDGKSRSTTISNAYSQGILDTLTQALQSSGMDLSQASISVQVDVGSRVNTNSMPSGSKEYTNQSSSNQAKRRAQASSSGGDFEQAQKSLRTEES